MPGPAQAAAFAWLGRFYREVASDAARARKCFQKALALDPTQADAGASECVLISQGTAASDRAWYQPDTMIEQGQTILSVLECELHHTPSCCSRWPGCAFVEGARSIEH